MQITKLTRLKEYSNKNLYKKLMTSVDALPVDFLSETLYTKNLLKYKAQKIAHCHDKYLTSLKRIVNIDTGEYKSKTELVIGKFCNQFIVCPICAKKRAAVIYRKYIERIKEHFNKYKYAYFVTFTVKNSSSFSKSWDILTGGLRKFRLLGQKREGGLFSYGESGKIKSGLGCGEVKKGSGSGLWHCHYHFLIFTDEKLNYEIYNPDKKAEIIRDYNENYGCSPDAVALRPAVKEFINGVPVSKLSKEWFAATNGNGINVDVKIINKKEYDINKNLREIIKYSSKIADLQAKDILELLVYKDKKRFFTTWGELRGVNGDDIDNDDLENTEDNLKIDYINESVVYDIEQNKYFEYDESENVFINELLEKKENLKTFVSLCNRTRARKNELNKSIKDKIFIQGLKNKDFKMECIKDIEAIKKAYDFYIEKLFRYVVNIKMMKDRKKIFRKLYGVERFYFKIFLEQGFIPDGET